MNTNEDKITYMGDADFRNRKTRFGIKNLDRARHMYVIGKTGMGKSTLLENMAAQDIKNGEGICFVDPHGSSAELLLEYVPEHRIDDVLYFAPFDNEYPIAFNPLEDVDPDNRHLVASGLMSAFKKIWVDAFSARMEYILSNAILALLETPESTLLSVNRMLVEKEFRKKVVEQITDPTVKAFWVDEYEKWDDRYRKEAGAAIQNKVGQFVSNPLIRNIVGQPKSSFDLRTMMDSRKIIIVNLSKGQIGEQNAGLLGGMFITKLYLAAMSRADLDKSELAKLPPFYFYVDEFQSFANESFADILSEARKYKLALTMAHQYVAQMPDEVREAIFGNIGSMVVFRVGPGDAEHFEREFAPVFTEQDIVNIGRFQYYLRLMIDGMGSQPFSAVGIPPLEKPPTSNKKAVIEMSRQKYAEKRDVVDKRITDWYVPIPSEKDLEHQDYIEKKKAEFAAQGKEWVDFSKNPEKKAEYEKQKASGDFGKKKFNNKKDFTKKNFDNKKPFVSKQSKPFSDKLKGLIDAIESGDAMPVEEVKKNSGQPPVIPAQAGIQKKVTKISDSESASNTNKKSEVSLSDLKPQPKKSLDRKAGAEQVSSLKDALAKAGIGAPKAEEEKKEDIKKPPVIARALHSSSEEVRYEAIQDKPTEVQDFKAGSQKPLSPNTVFPAKAGIQKEPANVSNSNKESVKPLRPADTSPALPERLGEEKPKSESRPEIKPELQETPKQSVTQETPAMPDAPEQAQPNSPEESKVAPVPQSNQENKFSPDELLQAILND